MASNFGVHLRPLTSATQDHSSSIFSALLCLSSFLNAAPVLDTATDYRPTTDYAYDENGNLTRMRHRWTDQGGAPISTAGETSASSYLATEYTYDTRNRVLSVGRENGTGLAATP